VVCVHGLNTTFDDALFRTAQMALPTSISTARRSSTAGPPVPPFTATATTAKLRAVGALPARVPRACVCKETGAKSVSLIAHSMGNMPLLRVLRRGPNLPPGVPSHRSLRRPMSDRNLFRTWPPTSSSTGAASRLLLVPRPAMAAARRVRRHPARRDVPSYGPIVHHLSRHHRREPYQHRLPGSQPLLYGEWVRSVRHRPTAAEGERPPESAPPPCCRIVTPKGDFCRLPAGPR